MRQTPLGQTISRFRTKQFSLWALPPARKDTLRLRNSQWVPNNLTPSSFLSILKFDSLSCLDMLRNTSGSSDMHFLIRKPPVMRNIVILPELNYSPVKPCIFVCNCRSWIGSELLNLEYVLIYTMLWNDANHPVYFTDVRNKNKCYPVNAEA